MPHWFNNPNERVLRQSHPEFPACEIAAIEVDRH
jgi:hypothetical protein